VKEQLLLLISALCADGASIGDDDEEIVRGFACFHVERVCSIAHMHAAAEETCWEMLSVSMGNLPGC